MILKRFYTNIIIRILLIAGSGVLFGYVVFYLKDPVINANVVAAILIQSYLLYRYIRLMRERLERFFDAISYDDSGLLVPASSVKDDFKALTSRLHILNKTINKGKRDIAKQSHYLMAVTENSGAGLLSFNKEGRINILNKSAKEILEIEKVGNIKVIDNHYKEFSRILFDLDPTEQRVIRFQSNQRNDKNLIIKASDFINEGVWERIVSIKDVGNELDAKEIESWQKMIRVLNHEVMNTVGPISSTLGTMKELLDEFKKEFGEGEKAELLEDFISGLEIISERTEGLNDFVQGFRSLTRIPDPESKEVILVKFLSNIQTFLKSDLDDKGVELTISIADDLESAYFDPMLIEQVLINLIKNSIEALENVEDPLVKIDCATKGEKLYIQIKDNGKGILPEIIDEIFVPFFTTKKEGSGIGLSLARQIVRLHKGNVTVNSEPGNGTVLIITIPR